jgi:hypothetical protein
MSNLLHTHHPFRIFAISAAVTGLSVLGVIFGMGWSAALIACLLIIIEVTFSFENAIINARVLSRMSRFWQQMFLTVGIVIAIFGMRVVFPIVIVALTAQLPWREVLDLALNDPKAYAEALEKSHYSIAAFGSMFLMMLGLHFFFEKRKVHWLPFIELPLQKIGRKWLHAPVALAILALIAPATGTHAGDVWTAGIAGIVTYLAVHGLSELFGHNKTLTSTAKMTGMAGLSAFLYLEVLDASFSFDGVVGAFAITSDVILIAVGLGVGAFWVRSLTIFMVRRGTLEAYRYLEHGAHYTILILASILLIGLFQPVPEVIAGLIGLVMIGASIVASVKINNKTVKAA